MVREVLDGVSFRLTSGELIRISGIVTGEIHRGRAKCAHEVRLGRAAIVRLRALLERGTEVEFTRVRRTRSRTIAHVTFEGHDLAKSLLFTGSASASLWRPNKAKQDWCSNTMANYGFM